MRMINSPDRDKNSKQGWEHLQCHAVRGEAGRGGRPERRYICHTIVPLHKHAISTINHKAHQHTLIHRHPRAKYIKQRFKGISQRVEFMFCGHEVTEIAVHSLQRYKQHWFYFTWWRRGSPHYQTIVPITMYFPIFVPWISQKRAPITTYLYHNYKCISLY